MFSPIPHLYLPVFMQFKCTRNSSLGQFLSPFLWHAWISTWPVIQRNIEVFQLWRGTACIRFWLLLCGYFNSKDENVGKEVGLDFCSKQETGRVFQERGGRWRAITVANAARRTRKKMTEKRPFLYQHGLICETPVWVQVF